MYNALRPGPGPVLPGPWAPVAPPPVDAPPPPGLFMPGAACGCCPPPPPVPDEDVPPSQCPPRIYNNPPDSIVDAGDGIEVETYQAENVNHFVVSAPDRYSFHAFTAGEIDTFCDEVDMEG